MVFDEKDQCGPEQKDRRSAWADVPLHRSSVAERPTWLRRDLLVLGEWMAMLAWNA